MTRIQSSESKAFQKIVTEGMIAGVKALKQRLNEDDNKLFNPYNFKEHGNKYMGWLKGWQWAFNDDDE